MEYLLKLNERELKLLAKLINQDMNQIVGDLGYQELSQLLAKLDALSERLADTIVDSRNSLTSACCHLQQALWVSMPDDQYTLQ